jgi:serine protease inhibitor
MQGLKRCIYTEAWSPQIFTALHYRTSVAELPSFTSKPSLEDHVPELTAGLKSLVASLSTEANSQFQIANAVVTSGLSEARPSEEYITALRNTFDAEVMHGSDAAQMQASINKFVADRTHGAIKELKVDIKSNTLLGVLLPR